MQKIIKLSGVYLAGIILYFIFIKVLSQGFDINIKDDIAWGIAVFYSYHIFAVVLFLSLLSREIRKKSWRIFAIILLFQGFTFYWQPSFSTYPNRVTAILLGGILIYSIIHSILFWTRRLEQKTRK